MTLIGKAHALGIIFFLWAGLGFAEATKPDNGMLLSSTENPSAKGQITLPKEEAPTRQFMDPSLRNQFEERDQDLRYHLNQELPHTPYRLDHTVIDYLNSQFWFHLTLPELHIEKIDKSRDSLGNPIISFHDDAISTRINQQLHHKVEQLITEGKKGTDTAAGLQYAPLYHLTYTVHHYSPALLSLTFDSMLDSKGAHPTREVSTHNFDLKTGNQLLLEELFKPNSHYLERLAELSNIELPREILKNNSAPGKVEGTQEQQEELASLQDTFKVLPAKEYFENWNLNEKGLMITFQYGLFCGQACGTPSILIPYAKLQDLLQPVVVERYVNSQH